MPLYTSSQTTPGGIVVNAVLDTVTNTITYTATATDGTVATSIQDTNAPGLRSLSSQINFGRDITAGSQFIDAINAVYTSVKKQETEAAAESKLTGEPPPNESNPIPVSPATDPFEQARTDAQNRANNAGPTSQDVINAETDPFEKARLEAAQRTTNPEPQVVLDPKDDPFEQARIDAQNRSNNPSPTAQDVIDAEQDPFEKARLEAAQKTTNIAPSAQDVIDAEEDPFERARLEAAQRTTNPQYEFPPEIDTSQDAAENAKFNRQQSLANAPVTSPNPSAKGSAKGLIGKRLNTRKQATAQDNANYQMLKDWRVRLSLAPSANGYLYTADPPGILAPLTKTNGVIFPYTPTVTANYVANYDPTELVHSNYKIFQYRSSAVDSITIVGDFTAQDTYEANYLLAVIHFFRSITKMFYGQDDDPVNGTPPPLCYLHGYGAFGFDNHPMVVTNFNCTFPNDVDYIRATTHNTVPAGTNTAAINVPNNSTNVKGSRMNGSNLNPGAGETPPSFTGPEQTSNNTGGTVEPTYVPTKMQITINASPVVSRNDISRRFSLKDYATGKLLRGSKSPTGGGIW